MENIDPIYGDEINEENEHILGKTKYSIYSLSEWFLVRKKFIDPMTNQNMSEKEINRLISVLKSKDLYPSLDEKITTNKMIIVMDRYHKMKLQIDKNNIRIGKLRVKVENFKKKYGLEVLNEKITGLEQKNDIIKRAFFTNIEKYITK